jgi:hypothetical protein
MCQSCVAAGEMTAEELATRLEAGDKSVVVMADLAPADFMAEVIRVSVSLIAEGLDPEQVVDETKLLVESYVRLSPGLRAMPEAERDDFLAKLAEI